MIRISAPRSCRNSGRSSPSSANRRKPLVIYAELDKAIATWEPARRQVLELNGSRINALFASGQTEAGLAAAQELLKREISRVGEKHFDTAAARGTLAVGYVYAGREADAIREFKAAIPVLMAASRENADDDDDTVTAARSQRLQTIVEAYIALLAKSNDNATGAVSLETFTLADSIRGQNVQKALSASSARSVAKDPALADLVRQEQDFGKQINAQLGALNNALSSNARDDKVVKATGQSIEKLRADRNRIRQEINKRFPSYAELIDPKPPTVDQIKAVLTVRGDAVVLFREAWQLRMGGSEGRAGHVRIHQGQQRRHRKQGTQVARGVGAAGGDDFRHPTVRPQSRLRTLFAAAQTGRGGLEIVEEPDRGDQRRARLAPAVAAADRARRTHRQ